MNRFKKNKQSGFTLIELIMVIVILGVLSAFAIPKFADLSDQAKISAHLAVASSFESGINIARMKYLTINRSSQGALEDVKIYSTNGRYGTLDFNSSGWPAQSYSGALETNPQANNVGDCRSVFVAIIQEETTTISTAADKDYQAIFDGAGVCTYENSQLPTLSFTYNSNTGEVSVDQDT